MRSFVALPLPDEVRRRVVALQARARTAAGAADVRWSAAASMHLTLKFLGEVAAEQVEAVEAALGRATVGFAIWQRGRGKTRSVTVPSRTYFVLGERRAYALLRPITDEGKVDAVRRLILESYAEFERRIAGPDDAAVDAAADAIGQVSRGLRQPAAIEAFVHDAVDRVRVGRWLRLRGQRDPCGQD